MWTEGSRASLQLRLDPAPSAGATLVMDATAFIPEGSGPMEVTVTARGQVAGHWHLVDADEHTLRMGLPAAAFTADGSTRLLFEVANPRRPAAWLPHSADNRLLGLKVRSVRFDAAP